MPTLNSQSAIVPSRAASGSIEEKLDNFKNEIIIDAELTEDQRDKANEDMRFVNVTGGMWEGFLDDQFQDRTKLEFDLVSNYLNRFLGQWNLNRVGVDFKPDDSSTSDDDAELMNGIYRADFMDGSGKLSTDNAVDELATCGIGHFKLATKFEDEGDPENNLQRIEWRPIYNSFNTVFWDSSAKRIDKRDGRRCTVLEQFTPESFETAYPGKEPVSAYTPDTREFFNFESDRVDIVYIASRYEIVRKKEFIYIYRNMITQDIELYEEKDHELIKDELKADEHREFVRKRKITNQHVEKSIFSGAEFLEKPKKILGKFIPIIPIYAFRSYVDGVEWYYGLVRKLKDAARVYNMQMSQLAENAATEGQEVPIFDPDQMPESIKGLWENLNNKSYLLAKALRDKDGKIIQHGPLSYLKPPMLSSSVEKLLGIIPAYFQDVTGGAPQDIMDPKASGKAIRALQKREDLNTQVIQDNIANSIAWSGEVYQSIAAEAYNVKRMIRTVGLDGTDGRKDLLKMVMDEQTGKMIQSNNLRGKKFRVYSDIGPQYETLREDSVEELKGMIELVSTIPGGQQMVPAMLSIMIENMTGAGLKPLKKINRQQMLAQGLVKPENDEEKQFLADLQEPQEDPQAQLVESLSKQAESEGEKFLSEARNLDSKSLDNVASAGKKEAETRQIISETENAKVKTLLDIQKENREQVQALPF